MHSWITIGFLALVLVPITLIFAWRKWITAVRADLPPWRNAACCVALILLSLNWCGAACLAFLVWARQDVSVLTEMMLTLSRPLEIVAIVLATALRGGSRVEALFAGLLMFAGWPIGYV